MIKETNAPAPQEDSLHKLEYAISRMLRSGVLLAGALLSVGWVWLWYNNGDQLQSFSVYESQPLWERIQWALIMNDRAFIVSFVGLAALVSLPLLRVLLTSFLFVKQKDYLLAVMALLVFLALIASFTLGIEI
ncbi:DUF1634 domain-containing protein [Bdellovibrio sp. 22V]|uniref:DUF1634 domain-containing protein n=1 Tax=Bdellovibrio TaxID=958 RepID=UPI002542E53A|nr:DUF1634 domain-containing protein [Bdellovibrio sp. 22V]WII71176.1 DUF1634 domain-containing protein [Bdellovibrio sp. 22V]